MKISFDYNPLLRESNLVITNVKVVMNTMVDIEEILSF